MLIDTIVIIDIVVIMIILFSSIKTRPENSL